MKKKIAIGLLICVIPFSAFSQINCEFDNCVIKLNQMPITSKTSMDELEKLVGEKGIPGKKRIAGVKEYWGEHTLVFHNSGITTGNSNTVNGINLIFNLKANLVIEPKRTYKGSLTINGQQVNDESNPAKILSLNLDTIQRYYPVYNSTRYEYDYACDLVYIHPDYHKDKLTYISFSFCKDPFELYGGIKFPPSKFKRKALILQKYLSMNPNGAFSEKAHTMLDSLNIIASRVSELTVGMSCEEVYEYFQILFGNPDEQLIQSGASNYSIEQSIKDFCNFGKEGKVTARFNSYELVFMDGKLIEYSKK